VISRHALIVSPPDVDDALTSAPMCPVPLNAAQTPGVLEVNMFHPLMLVPIGLLWFSTDQPPGNEPASKSSLIVPALAVPAAHSTATIAAVRPRPNAPP